MQKNIYTYDDTVQKPICMKNPTLFHLNNTDTTIAPKALLPILQIIKNSPSVIWCYGYSAAGKSTLAMNMHQILQKNQVPNVVLDGDLL